MLKRVFCIFVVLIFAVSLTSCTTVRKKNLEQQGLKNQIQALEAQLQERDQQVANLKDSLAKEMQEKEDLSKETSQAKFIGEVKSRPNARQIQVALKNAGYDPGKIDGKMGKKTREAIKAFQKAKGLKADAKVGKLTWQLLREHLYAKTK